MIRFGRPVAVILAGGKSWRMGTDKAALAVNGRTMLARAVAAARVAGLVPVVIGRAAADLPSDCLGGVISRPDELPGTRGPLSGLATGLAVAGPGNAVLLLSCDLPRLRPADIRWLMRTAAQGRGSAVIPAAGGRLHPLAGIYPSALHPAVHRQLGSGRQSMMALLKRSPFRLIPVPTLHLGLVRDADTPADLP